VNKPIHLIFSYSNCKFILKMFGLFSRKDKKPTIWVVTDGTEAVVQAMELAKRITDEKNIVQFDRMAAHSHSKGYPDFAIGARMGVADTLLGIKARSGGKTAIVQILDPQKNHKDFDYIILPSYEPYKVDGRVISTIGLINYINDKVLEKAKQDLEKSKAFEYLRKKNLKAPFIAVMIGGKHVGGNVEEQDGRKLAEKLNYIIGRKGGTALISTSKRTEFTALRGFREVIKVPHFIYDYKIREYDNPYDIFLHLAEEVIVTGDSVRMMSEACSAGKKVRIFRPQELGFQYVPLLEELIRGGYAIDFETPETEYGCDRLDEAGRIASMIV